MITMRELNSVGSSQYGQHAVFTFEGASLELPIELLRKFNKVYADARQIASTLEAKSVVGLYQDCVKSLGSIFQYLIAHIKKSFHSRFIEVLLMKVGNLRSKSLSGIASHNMQVFAIR